MGLSAKAESSGTCGDNLKWHLTDGGVLTISGKGEMYDYTYGNSAPWRYSGVKRIIIGDSVTTIGGSAFGYCSSLTSVTIPNSVATIGESAFTNNKAKIIWLTNTPPGGYSNVSGRIHYVANDLYTRLSNKKVYPYLSSIFEVNGIKYVPVSPSERTCDAIDCAYTGEPYEVKINKKVNYKGVDMTVREINPYTAYNCTKIKKAYIDIDGSIGGNAFSDCVNLSAVDIAKVNDIGYNAFSGCTNLTSVGIKKTNNIGNNAFSKCTNLVSVDIKAGNNIGKSAFSNCSSLKTLSLDNKIKSLGQYAFWGCSNLTQFVIPDSVTMLNYDLLKDCASLKSIRIHKGIKEIYDAFSGCTNLSTFIIEDRNTSLKVGLAYGGNPLFKDCKLDSVYIGGKIVYNTSHNGEYSPFYRNTSLRTVKISDAETTIYDNEFYGCTNLQNVSIGGNVKSIGKWAFSGCSNLTQFVIPDSVTILNSGLLDGCSSLKSIRIHKGIREMYHAFSGCTNLSTLIIEDRNTSLKIVSDNNPLFKDCKLDSVYIGGKIVYNTSSDYGYSPFYRNTSLRTVRVSDAETTIYDNEFYGCTNLQNVSIGDNVKSIGKWAFSGCSSLKNFTFGSGLQSIGQEAFSDCINITHISSKAVVPPTCDINALDDINKWNCKLFVPKANINAYKQAPQWKEFFFIESTTGITNTVNNKAGLVDVYTIDGTKRLSKASTDEINALPKGVYIVNGKKIIIK